MTSPSLLTRVLRAFTALVTVWCLGCSAFEPLLVALAGDSGSFGMSCGSEGIVEGGAVVADAGGDGAMIVRDASTESSSRDCLCQCQGCHAPSPIEIVATVERTPAQRLPVARPGVPLSVLREPLVPPPQLSL
jgi:hypothetical protein